MRAKTDEKTEVDGLLKNLREANIWELTESQARTWLSLAGRIWHRATPEDEILSMKLCSLVAELADRRGWWYTIEREALDARDLDPIRERFYDQQKLLRPRPVEARVDFKWFRQAGWLLLQDARREHRSEPKGPSTEKHKNAAELALHSAKRLETHVKTILPAEGCHELLYRVAFSIARHHQVLEHYKQSEEKLIKSLFHCHELRGEIRKRLEKLEDDRHSRALDDQENRAKSQELTVLDRFTVFNTTIVVANLGRIDVERGRLTQALPQLSIAKTLLLDSQDIVMKAFVDLQLGTVYRQLRPGVADAEELICSAIKRFESAGHRPLVAKGKVELARYYFGKAAISEGDLKKARDLLEEHGGSDGGRQRWEAQRSLLLARIEFAEGTRKSRREAKTNAEIALERARTSGLTEVEAITNIVLAELALRDGDCKKALDCAREAERLNPRSAEDKAWMYLVLAEAWKLEGSLGNAQRFFDRWEKIGQGVENERIRERAAELERSLEDERKRGFFISADDDIDLDRHTEKLKEFLISQARSRGSTIPEQARLLGVKPQTLANWRSLKKKAPEGD